MDNYQNILVVRTDRIGDVLLTTPAIAALREAYPKARLSILVSPATRELVQGNTNLNEILVDDRKVYHKGLAGFWSLVLDLRKKKFDLAIVFHTKKRTNLLCFLAGIPQRVGYCDSKFGFLLTKKIPDTRPQGLKHESQYCLDVLQAIGIEKNIKRLDLPIAQEAEDWAAAFFRKHAIEANKPLIAIHPGASCISKRWMPERFAQVAEQLVSQHQYRVIFIGAADNRTIVDQIKSIMKNPVIDITGETSLGQLAAVLKRCQLLISNDSGPVHMAVSLGVPVISIFGRNQAGLSPVRWGPLGDKDIVLHKEVGCEVCLAHNCQINFLCLQEVKTDEVLEAVDAIARLW